MKSTHRRTKARHAGNTPATSGRPWSRCWVSGFRLQPLGVRLLHLDLTRSLNPELDPHRGAARRPRHVLASTRHLSPTQGAQGSAPQSDMSSCAQPPARVRGGGLGRQSRPLKQSTNRNGHTQQAESSSDEGPQGPGTRTWLSRTSAVVTFPPTVSLQWDLNPGLWGWIATPQASGEFRKCRNEHVAARSLTERRLIRAVSFLKVKVATEGPEATARAEARWRWPRQKWPRRPLGSGGEHAPPRATEPWADAVTRPKPLSHHQDCHPMALTAQEPRCQCRGAGFRAKASQCPGERRAGRREGSDRRPPGPSCARALAPAGSGVRAGHAHPLVPG